MRFVRVSLARVLPVSLGTLALLGLTAAVSTPARAQTADISFNVVYTGAPNINTLQFASNLDQTNFQTLNVYTSAYATTFGGEDIGNTYCVDLQHLVTTMPYSASLRPITSYDQGLSQNVSVGGNTYNRGNALAYLFGNYGSASAGFGGTSSASSAAEISSALQIALWKAAYDWNGTASSLDFGSGNLRFAGNTSSDLVLFDANQMLASLNNWNGTAPGGIGYYRSNLVSGQSLIGGTAGGSSVTPPSPLGVPEPGTLALLAVPGIGLAARAIRRRK